MKKLLVILFVGLFSSVIHSMGDGVVKGHDGVLEPRYMRLAEGQELFRGKVYDEKVVVDMRELSFSGHTVIDGLRREDDDSSTTINLTDYKEIIIDEQVYQSKRYPEKELTLVSLVTKDGTVLKGYLAPCNLIVSGIEKEGNAEKAWFLKKVDRITIERNKDGAGETTNYVNKIFKEKPAQGLQDGTPQASLLDQTATTTASQINTTSTIKIDPPTAQPLPESKTVAQAFIGIANSFIDLIKAIFGTVKKIIRWMSHIF